jgi:hypothetical protein
MRINPSRMNLKLRFISSDYRKTFRVLSSADKKKIPLVIAIQIFFGFLLKNNNVTFRKYTTNHNIETFLQRF